MTARRYLAHRIVCGDAVYPLSVAEISCIDGCWSVRIFPFSTETEGTVFHSGTLKIVSADGSPYTDGSGGEPTLIFC